MDQSESPERPQGPLQEADFLSSRRESNDENNVIDQELQKARQALHDLRLSGTRQRELQKTELHDLHQRYQAIRANFRKRWAALDEQTRAHYTRALRQVFGTTALPPPYVLRHQVDLMHASHQVEMVLEHQIELLELQDAELVAMFQTELRREQHNSQQREAQHLSTVSRMANRNHQVYELQAQICKIQEQVIQLLRRESEKDGQHQKQTLEWKKDEHDEQAERAVEDEPTVETSGHSRSSSESISDEFHTKSALEEKV